MPALRVVHLDCDGRPAMRPRDLDTIDLSETDNIIHLPAEFAAWLRRCPRLRMINHLRMSHLPADSGRFDWTYKLEVEGRVTGRIYSMRHAGSEVLYGCMDCVDVHRRDPVAANETYITRILYTTSSPEIRRLDGVVDVDGPFEHMFSDFEGMVVPLEVIRRMQRAGGYEPGEHGSIRGDEVGAEVWSVLTSWKAEEDAR